MLGDESLAGLPAGRARKPREWGIELTAIGAATGTMAAAIRVTLIDRETGKRVGSREVPWAEFRDTAHGLVLVNIAEGVHE
jgi:hypothetical protein